jgi:hypothetical protein
MPAIKEQADQAFSLTLWWKNGVSGHGKNASIDIAEKLVAGEWLYSMTRCPS